MHRFTCCLVFLVISATPNSANKDTWVPSSTLTQNKETKPTLKDWFFHMAIEDLIEFKTDAEDLMRVAHLPATPEFPHPSIGALLDKSHATYPVQHHCAAPQHGGEMRLMLQLVPKELICREISLVPLEPEISSQLQLEPEISSQLQLEPDSSTAQSVSEKTNLDVTDIATENKTGGGTEEIETTRTTSNGADETTDALVSLVEVEEVAEEDIDEGSGIVYSPLVTKFVDSSTVEPEAPKVILKEVATSIANISIDGLPESKFPTENLLSLSTVEVGPDDPQTLVAALFPSSLWMLNVETSDEGIQYSVVDHLDFHDQIEDQNAQAVSINFLPIYLTMNDDSPSLNEMEDGSWENFVMIHKKISPGLNAKLNAPTISPLSQLMEADLALIRVGKNGTFYPFYYSFQAELPWSPVQASLSFTRDKSSFVVYATKDTITGYQISQSAHSNKLIRSENLDSIALTDSVVDMALAQIDSKFFLVVLEKLDDNSSTVKVFTFVKKSELYDLDSNSVFEMKMPDQKFFKLKSFNANSTNYMIFAGSDSNAALYSIENSGKLIHRQDFSLDEIIDVHFVELNASSNEDLLIFIQNTGAVLYFLESPHTWKHGRQVFFDNVLASKSDSHSIIAISNAEGGLAFVISNSSGSLVEMNLSVGSDMMKSEDDRIQAKTDEHGLEDTKESSIDENTDESVLDTKKGSVEAKTDESVLEDAKTDKNSLEDTTVLEELDDSLQPAEEVNNFTLIENEVDEVTIENDLEEFTNIVQSVDLMDNSTNKEDFFQYSQNEDTTINYRDSTTTVINEINVENAPEALHLTLNLDSQNDDNEAENTMRSTSVNSLEPLNDFNNSGEENTEVTTSNSVKNVQNEQITTKQLKHLKLLEPEENVLVELIRILKFYIYLSKDNAAEAVNGLKPLIGLLKDVRDHEELKKPDYASSIVNVIADLENSQDNEKVNWDSENVKKLELVLNIVADIVNKVERTPMTVNVVIQLLEEIKSSDQFSNDTEAIEYAVHSLKEHSELNVSIVENSQTDVILLKINFILNARDVKSLNQTDLKSILQELKPLTKYNGRELEVVKLLLNELSYLKDQQKDWINEKLTKVNKNGLVDVSSLREVVSKMEEDLKNYEERVSARKEDLFPGNSTVKDIINSDDDDEDVSNMVNMLNNYVEELKLLDAQVTENAFGAQPLIAYNSTAEEAINSDDNEANEDGSDMIQLLTGYVEDLKSREAEDLSATTALNLNEDHLEIKSSTETVSNSEYEEDRVNGLVSDDMDGVVPPDSKFSEDEDWCSRGNNCHPMANCENGEKNYTCLCKNGFQGNGTHCEETVTTTSAASSREAQVVILKEGQESVPEKQVELSNLLQLIKRFKNYIEEKELKLNPEANGQKPTENEEVSVSTEQEPTENEEVSAVTEQERTENELEESVGTEQEGSRDERKLEALTMELEEVLAEHEETLNELEKDSTRLEHEPTDQGKEQATSLSQSEKLRLLTELTNALRIFAEKMETESSKMENKDISTGNDGTSTGDENTVLGNELETGRNQTVSVSSSEEGSAQLKDTSTESEYTTEESAQFKDKSTQYEYTTDGSAQLKDKSTQYEYTTDGSAELKDKSTQYEYTTEGSAQLKDKSTQSEYTTEEGLAQFEDTSTQSENTIEGSAQFKDKSTQSEHITERLAQFGYTSTQSEHTTEERLAQFGYTSTQSEHTTEERLAQFGYTSTQSEYTTEERLAQFGYTSTQSEYTTEEKLAQFGYTSTQSEYTTEEGLAQFEDTSTQSEYTTEERLAQFEDTSTQSEHTTEERMAQFGYTSTQSEYTTEEGLAQFEDTSTQSEYTTEKAKRVLSESKDGEVRAFIELIKKFRIYIEKIESEAKSAKNDTASSGLWPLIEHLDKLSTMQEVNKSLNMSKEVDNLIEQLKQADQHFANASWDAEKLDMILDIERELIENKTSETVIETDNKGDVSSELVNGMQNQEEPDTEVQSFVKDTNEDEGETSGTMSDGEDGELKWLIEGLSSTKLNSSIVSKVKKADQRKTSDLELLKEILRDLEQEKEIYESTSMSTSNENLPESRSLTGSSGRGTIEDESVVDDEDMEALIESHVEELESQVEELKSVVEQALDEDDRKTSTDKNEEEIPDSKEAEGSDWCSRYSANCHRNAECLNGASNYTCRCKNGFEGNGTHCQPAGEFENTTEPEENTNTTESNIEGVSVNASKLATDDTASKETASLELKELIFDWREKFFIILAFFILFAVLFLIIIAVLIYKVKQSGEYAPIDAPNVGPSD